MPIKFEIVTANATRAVRGDDLVAHAAANGLTLSPRVGGKHLRPELQGMPELEGFCGPMWGGFDEAGTPVIRYEDWPSYDRLSR